MAWIQCVLAPAAIFFSITVSIGFSNGQMTSLAVENGSSTTTAVDVDSLSSDTVLAPTNSDVYVFRANDSNGFLARNVTDFVCKPQHFCNRNLADDWDLCSFECSPCRCDEICHFFGDCCPDELFKDSDMVPSSPMESVSCVRGVWTQWGEAESVMMISRCPSRQFYQDDDETVVEKCQNPDIRDRNQATPVSSVLQGLTYRNEYCASCHGVRDVEGWRHDVLCENMTDLSSVKSTEELWLLVLNKESACTIVTNPPLGVTPRNCSHSAIDSCNVTGKWLSYDPQIEALCGMYNHTVDYYGFTSSYVSYRNVFCAVCNGIELTKRIICSRYKSTIYPHPMSVLLAFNPSPVPLARARVLHRAPNTECDTAQAYDPVSMTCRAVECPERRMFEDGQCMVPFSTITGLGFKIDVVLHQLNGSEDFLSYFDSTRYKKLLKERLVDFFPLIISSMTATFLRDNLMPFTLRPDRILIHAEIITLSNQTLQAIEDTLWEFMSMEQMYPGPEGHVVLSSKPEVCPQGFLASRFVINTLTSSESASILSSRCEVLSCSPPLATVGPGCPFLQYNISQDNFTFDEETSSITINNSIVIQVNASRIVRCGMTLRICLDVLSVIRTEMASREPNNSWAPFAQVTPAQDISMSIVSLVCTALSLFCLALTFFTYTCIKKLKTVPGMNTSALVFHLFWSQLLFLVGSNRTENFTVCKTFGVLTHFFWLATFSWMATSAHHMYSVFTKLRPLPSTGRTDVSRFLKHCLFCILAPICVVSSCIAYHMIPSDGMDIGYGGNVCFINDPIGIVVFFAVPLTIMLIANTIFFILTVLAIRSVPDIKEATHVTQKHHVYVYIKLAALFGFTWVFGIVAEILRSDILRYTFIVLTGSQGVFIFLAYCANRRTLNIAKSMLWSIRSGSTSEGSDPSKHNNKKKQTASTSLPAERS